ncbi:MAG: helix-turn-helix transcriptional regulator, partial [Elusimicrobiota bacterium]
MTGPFEETVREAMEARGMGLRELCRRAGLDPSFFSKVLAGKRSPPPDDRVRRIAEALGLDEVRLIVAAGRIPREWSRLCRDEDACRRVGEFASADPGLARLSPAPAAPAPAAGGGRRRRARA